MSGSGMDPFSATQSSRNARPGVAVGVGRTASRSVSGCCTGSAIVLTITRAVGTVQPIPADHVGVGSPSGPPCDERCRGAVPAAPAHDHAPAVRSRRGDARRGRGVRQDDAAAPVGRRQPGKSPRGRCAVRVQPRRRAGLALGSAPRRGTGARCEPRSTPTRPSACCAARSRKTPRCRRACSSTTVTTSRPIRRADNCCDNCSRVRRGNAHFVVASRGRVAGLARRRAQRDVVEVDEAAMRFTESEVERAARSGSVDVRTATSELGGWPALIGLALSFGTEAAREFAREEVLDALDRRRQRALAALATIGGGDRALCAAVVESVVGPTPTLDEVIAGLPLVMVDGATIEPHSLWKNLLADVLDEEARARSLCARGRGLPCARRHCAGVRPLRRDRRRRRNARRDPRRMQPGVRRPSS